MKNFIYIMFLMLLFFINCTIDKTPLQPQRSCPDGIFSGTYDLRNVDGTNYVTSVKSQTGGTCWTHGTIAAIEGNLLMTGNWETSGEINEPDLAEYHLDWWNGFNQHWNSDLEPPTGSGLEVHNGGDYFVAAAYFSRLHGAVIEMGQQSYDNPPELFKPDYHKYYPRHIEWLTSEDETEQINLIKSKLIQYGVIATCLFSNFKLINDDYIHYQPEDVDHEPNHSVAIIGWDDCIITNAAEPGAWLCKNSWGDWGIEGYFWISYYDKHCGKNPDMGAISFQDVEVLQYDTVYYHDYHGWRDTKTDCNEAFNVFNANANENIKSVSFFTASNNVDFTIKIYDNFINGELDNQLAIISGNFTYKGFHTVDLNTEVIIPKGDDFYIYLSLSGGGQPYDCTSDVPVLLGAKSKVIVESTSMPHQSYYLKDSQWKDIYNENETANFCIKGLTIRE